MDVLFECVNDEIVIHTDDNIWLYILEKQSWDYYNDRLTKKRLKLSTHIINTKVKCGDIIVIMITESRKNGFYAIGEVGSSMERNKDKHHIFNDDTYNKYFIELKTLSIFDKFIPISKSTIMTLKLFKKYAKNLHDFVNINDIGLDIIKNIYENNNVCVKQVEKPIKKSKKKINKKTQKNDIIDELIEEEFICDIITDEQIENPKKKINKKTQKNDIIDNLIDEDFNNDRIVDNIKNDYVIVNNVPIMILSCIELKRKLKHLTQDKKKINIILEHHNCCTKCEVINNNENRDLNMTLRKIKTDDILIDEDEDEDLIEKYCQSEIKQEILNELFVKIHCLSEQNFYNNDVLIEYSSQIKRKYLSPCNNIIDM